MKTKKIVIIILVSVIVIIAGILAGMLGIRIMQQAEQKKYDNKISLGDKYLEDEDYEKAILAYTEAIDIDSKNVQAYIALSKVYIQNEQYEDSQKVLESAPIKEMKDVSQKKIESQIIVVKQAIEKKTQEQKEQQEQKAQEEAKKEQERLAQEQAQQEQERLAQEQAKQQAEAEQSASSSSGQMQTWTITKYTTNYFTENQSVTYTKEWETGTVHTIVPQFEVGVGELYRILSFTVDMQARTVYIFMDATEGASSWGGLVIDLANNTYYGTDYSTP